MGHYFDELRKKKMGIKEDLPTVGKLSFAPDMKTWFADRDRELTGICGCGCGQRSSKGTPDSKASAAHILPKKMFPSVALHPFNFVERNFWSGCHTNMDERGMSKWPNMADWETIKTRFMVLVPFLTREERSKKYCRRLHKLVFGVE